ncbi:hypothetical protein EV203_11651 [Caldanaerobacter subterraneus]|uniref:Uncharacterized protein n=1 Tax=Caldanaerobacter subterraneus TaxID=911092 RepID=A0A4R2JVJ2_9THEO|nr:hypothetical protein EV203_11651 [Caldanaerobacter subterraneus]
MKKFFIILLLSVAFLLVYVFILGMELLTI